MRQLCLRIGAVGVCCLLVFGVLGIAPGLANEISGEYGIGENASLADLLEGGVIIAGDKRFSNFSYNLVLGDLQPEEIGVVGIFDDVINGYGLLFSGNFVAGGLSAPSKLEAGLSFTVTALDPNFVISDVHLDGTTFVRGTGDAQIVENFSRTNVPSLSIYELRVDDELIASKSSDEVFFPDALDVLGFRTMRVLKDISLEVGDNTPFDKAEITTFQQVFTQLPIPEPASLGLVLLMGICLAGFENRRRIR